MAKLHAAARNALPASAFGLPKTRQYPMPDRSHAINAKARAAEMYHEGKLTRAHLEEIDRKADRVIARDK